MCLKAFGKYNWNLDLQGKNIKLRLLEPTDLEWLMQVENDESMWHLSNTHEPYTAQQLADYIANAKVEIFEALQMRWVVSFQNQNVGLIDLFDLDRHHKRAGVGILITKAFQNQKLGSEALQLLVEHAFQFLKLHQLYANINTDNLPSLKLFQNAGFEINGTKKDWNIYDTKTIDEHFLQLINPNENQN